MALETRTDGTKVPLETCSDGIKVPLETCTDGTKVAERGRKMERRVYTFFYGLFMDQDALRGKGYNPVDIRPAHVAGMTLRLGDRATLVPDPSGRVYGMLMALSHAELDRLYAEPSVAAYRPEPVLARLPDGAGVPALCFNLPVAPDDPHQSNQDYAAKLQAMARRLGLPEDYIAGIR